MNCKPNSMVVVIKVMPVHDKLMNNFECGQVDIVGHMFEITTLESHDPPVWTLKEHLLVDAVVYGSSCKAMLLALGDRYIKTTDGTDGVEDNEVWKNVPIPRETLKLPAPDKKLQGEKT